MPTYAHTRDGEVTERVTTVPGSSLHLEMVRKAADDASGWAYEAPPAEAPDRPRERRRGRGTARVVLNSAPAPTPPDPDEES